MAILQTSTILFTLILAMEAMSVTSAQEVVSIPPVVIAGDGVDECPSGEERQAAHDLQLSVSERVLRKYSNNPNCGPGIWRQVFYLNASNEEQSCPGDWNARTSVSLRGCTGTSASCQSAYSGEISSEYSKVCGRIIGIGHNSPDAFHRFISGQTTIEGNYLDGVSITHGAPGSRTHIWSFGASFQTSISMVHCPCKGTGGTLPPPEVGENYFCSDRHILWTGSDCAYNDPCCSFHNPPYFSVQLPSPTTDQIELRVCADQHVGDEYVLVQFAEIYVQ